MNASYPYILYYSQKYNIPLPLAVAQAKVESGMHQYNRKGQPLTSTAGAIGVYQLEPSTARQLGVNPYSRRQNIEGGLKYDRELLNQYRGNYFQMLEAYNAGGNDLAAGAPYAKKVLALAASEPTSGGGSVSFWQNLFQWPGPIANTTSNLVGLPPIAAPTHITPLQSAILKMGAQENASVSVLHPQQSVNAISFKVGFGLVAIIFIAIGILTLTRGAVDELDLSSFIKGGIE